ncbi:hypothetical protein IRJ41_003814 [Triplophysa rosa]|uniref:Secreted protein n=1 Tax=Triplophysa rosa TaxID=992332 RepID=A0A9W7TDD4_TRIRA|nr:hypothetical protein IRJ41_003814 [Triplophysa rosa]
MGCHLLVLTICELVNAQTAAEAQPRREQQEVAVSHLFSQFPLPTRTGKNKSCLSQRSVCVNAYNVISLPITYERVIDESL